MVGSYDGCWGRLEDALAGSFGGAEGRNWTITPSRMPSPRPDPPARSCCLFPPPQVAEYENCRLLLVDKKISTARDIIGILEAAIRGGYPLLIMAEDIEQVRTVSR